MERKEVVDIGKVYISDKLVDMLTTEDIDELFEIKEEICEDGKCSVNLWTGWPDEM